MTELREGVGQLAPGEMSLVEVDGQPITVANVRGTLFAFDDLCTHRQCSLSEGQLDGDAIVCGCHDSRFDVMTGRPLSGPAKRPLATYPVEVTADGLRIGSAFAPRAAAPAQQAEEENALRHVALFGGLDEASLHALQELSFRRTFEPGEVIVEEGRTGNGAYVILTGKVEVIRGLPDSPQVVASMAAGAPFGELALLGDWKRTASVQAVERTTCVGIDRWVFLAFLRREPQLAAKMLQVVAQRLVETDPELAIEALQQVAQRLVEADRRVYG
jgi:3-phenylpropionate/trans-cinnamate dioxygenase ferredoxin component